MKNNTTLDQFIVQVEGPYEPPEGWRWVRFYSHCVGVNC
jgi:hypothetical protein